MRSNRKVILYIAMSLDGYIAKPNDDLETTGKLNVFIQGLTNFTNMSEFFCIRDFQMLTGYFDDVFILPFR